MDQLQKKGNLSITIHKRDISVLDFIKKELEYDGPINQFCQNKPEFIRLSISRISMIDKLKKLGVIPNKTYEMKDLPEIPEEFFGSYLLGFFDGDGYVSNLKRDNAISFSNSKDVLLHLQAFFVKKFNIKGSLRLRREGNDNTGMLEIKGSIQISTIYNYMYKDCSFCLKRKKDKFARILKAKEIYENKSYKLNGNYDKIISLYNNGVNQNIIAEQLKIPYSSLRNVVQRARKNGDTQRVDGVSKRKISIGGNIFNSMSDAGRYIKTSSNNILHRCKSKNYPDYKFIN